jgi:hypothetical protein
MIKRSNDNNHSFILCQETDKVVPVIEKYLKLLDIFMKDTQWNITINSERA